MRIPKPGTESCVTRIKQEALSVTGYVGYFQQIAFLLNSRNYCEEGDCCSAAGLY